MHLFPNYKTVNIPISGRNYTLYVADDFEKRRKGLANIPFIPRNKGMLFKYAHFQVFPMFLDFEEENKPALKFNLFT